MEPEQRSKRKKMATGKGHTQAAQQEELREAERSADAMQAGMQARQESVDGLDAARASSAAGTSKLADDDLARSVTPSAGEIVHNLAKATAFVERGDVSVGVKGYVDYAVC